MAEQQNARPVSTYLLISWDLVFFCWLWDSEGDENDIFGMFSKPVLTSTAIYPTIPPFALPYAATRNADQWLMLLLIVARWSIQVVLSTHGLPSKKIWSSMLGMENRTTPSCSCECAHQEVVLVDFPACWCSFFPLPSSNGLATDCSTAGSSRGFFFMSCREVPKCRAKNAKKWLCALDSSRMS